MYPYKSKINYIHNENNTEIINKNLKISPDLYPDNFILKIKEEDNDENKSIMYLDSDVSSDFEDDYGDYNDYGEYKYIYEENNYFEEEKLKKNDSFYVENETKNQEYKGLYLLEKKGLDENSTENIFIVPYHIKTVESFSFIQIMLNKTIFNNTENISFLSFKNNDKKITETKNYAFNVFEQTIKKYFQKDYFLVENNYKGYKNYQNNTFIFFDISNLNIDNYFIKRNDVIWFAVYDEIINYKKICNFKIDNFVVNFFRENIDFLNILDLKTNENYDYPIIAYTGNNIQKIKFENVFGTVKTQQYFGDYYYFTTYNEAIKETLRKITQTNANFKGGIARFVLFLKKTKYILTDNDYVENWDNKYDTLYVNNKNYKMYSNPCWVAKKYEQQYPLSYHIINFENCDVHKEKMDNFNNFYIT